MCRATEGVEGVMGKLVGRVVRVGIFLAISDKLSGVHGRGASTASSLSRTCARRVRVSAVVMDKKSREERGQ